MNTPSNRKRAIETLVEGMKECKLKQGTIITLAHEEHIETEVGEINIIPARLWSLNH